MRKQNLHFAICFEGLQAHAWKGLASHKLLFFWGGDTSHAWSAQPALQLDRISLSTSDSLPTCGLSEEMTLTAARSNSIRDNGFWF